VDAVPSWLESARTGWRVAGLENEDGRGTLSPMRSFTLLVVIV
jgi:hypothetical protein